MRSEETPWVRLEDYRPSDYRIPKVSMTVAFDPRETIVTTTLTIEPRSGSTPGAPLILDGDDLDLVSAALNDEELAVAGYTSTPNSFVLEKPPAGEFELTLTTRLCPERNTQLMGLYFSEGPILHPVRSGRFSADHLLPRPPGCAFGLHGQAGGRLIGLPHSSGEWQSV